ncbi:hypothetical protein QUF61_07085 [Candidatus Venteria ishoeyi]|uniref:hypothetical protein n=1 Tax=Candidatus Venteria ishoeyi TaxID=1899563 RepID=UPI0025A5EF0E|nr:hypothetical protein [Candidatus Venteria ishoeyi]MDM8546243.1 hypothetical protein [Candidatus Venteria ishoeyi]
MNDNLDTKCIEDMLNDDEKSRFNSGIGIVKILSNEEVEEIFDEAEIEEINEIKNHIHNDDAEEYDYGGWHSMDKMNFSTVKEIGNYGHIFEINETGVIYIGCADYMTEKEL